MPRPVKGTHDPENVNEPTDWQCRLLLQNARRRLGLVRGGRMQKFRRRKDSFEGRQPGVQESLVADQPPPLTYHSLVQVCAYVESSDTEIPTYRAAAHGTISQIVLHAISMFQLVIGLHAHAPQFYPIGLCSCHVHVDTSRPHFSLPMQLNF
jgi:hypothetical protein